MLESGNHVVTHWTHHTELFDQAEESARPGFAAWSAKPPDRVLLSQQLIAEPGRGVSHEHLGDPAPPPPASARAQDHPSLVLVEPGDNIVAGRDTAGVLWAVAPYAEDLRGVYPAEAKPLVDQ